MLARSEQGSAVMRHPTSEISQLTCHGSLTFPVKTTLFSPKIGISDTSQGSSFVHDIVSYLVPGKPILAFDCRVSGYHE